MRIILVLLTLATLTSCATSNKMTFVTNNDSGIEKGKVFFQTAYKNFVPPKKCLDKVKHDWIEPGSEDTIDINGITIDIPASAHEKAFMGVILPLYKSWIGNLLPNFNLQEPSEKDFAFIDRYGLQLSMFFHYTVSIDPAHLTILQRQFVENFDQLPLNDLTEDDQEFLQLMPWIDLVQPTVRDKVYLTSEMLK